MPKEYLGDSVYVDHDGYHLVLTTENGLGPNNTIYMDGNVYEALVCYAERLKERIKEQQADAREAAEAGDPQAIQEGEQ